jgi:hypothetical protein
VTPALLDSPVSPCADPSASPNSAAGPDRMAGTNPMAGPNPAARRNPAAGPNPAPSAVGGCRMTLEERLNFVLHEARAHGSTDCPICHARMTREAAAASAACGGCGSRLT